MLSFLHAPLLAIALTLAALPALAHASPPDPSWIPGLYDDADYDDVVRMVTSGTGDVPACPPTDLRPMHALVTGLAPSSERAPVGLGASAARPRAPPAP
jgi:hypothetical protein